VTGDARAVRRLHLLLGEADHEQTGFVAAQRALHRLAYLPLASRDPWGCWSDTLRGHGAQSYAALRLVAMAGYVHGLTTAGLEDHRSRLAPQHRHATGTEPDAAAARADMMPDAGGLRGAGERPRGGGPRRGRDHGEEGRLMGRRRTGWIRQQRAVWYFGLTLRSGRSFEKKIPPPADGTPYDHAYAHKVRATLVHAYGTGTWDPEAPQPTVAPDLADPTLVAYVRAWADRQTYESAAQDRKLVERYLAPSPIANLPVKDLRPRHLITLLDWLGSRTSARGGTLAPRTVRHAFQAVQRALDHAIIDALLPTNPCKVVRKHLPAVQDKDPTKRQGWLFARSEIALLIHDPRTPHVRRMIYAIAFATGARIGEIIALRLRDYDPAQEPLARITIARAKKSVTKKVGGTKTGAIKLVPVHPTLKALLDAWLATGWPALIGRDPRADDLIVPTKDGGMRDVSHHNDDLRGDCARLGVALRHQHCTRHTFISLAQDDGGDGTVLRWITHAPPRSAFDGYTRGQWGRLCAEVAKLNLPLPPTAANETVQGDGGEGGGGSASINREISRAATTVASKLLQLQQLTESGREDLNLRLHRPERCALPGCATPRKWADCTHPSRDVKRSARNRHAPLSPLTTHPRTLFTRHSTNPSVPSRSGRRVTSGARSASSRTRSGAPSHGAKAPPCAARNPARIPSPSACVSVHTAKSSSPPTRTTLAQVFKIPRCSSSRDSRAAGATASSSSTLTRADPRRASRSGRRPSVPRPEQGASTNTTSYPPGGTLSRNAPSPRVTSAPTASYARVGRSRPSRASSSRPRATFSGYASAA
jgi:integrase